MPTMTLWQHQISPYADKVRRVMHFKGIEFAVREVMLMETPKLKSVSASGKFPVLEVAGKFIIDSTDICDFLETEHPAKPLSPEEPRDAALSCLLEDWADESLYFYDLTMRSWPQNIEWLLDDLLIHQPPGFANKMLRKMIPKRMVKNTKVQGVGRKDQSTVVRDITRLFEAVDTLIQTNKWLIGDEMSRADIAVRSMTLVINRAVEGRAALDALPKLRAWEARVDKLTLPKPA